jgi:outer membrane protein insertion porin family
LIFTIKEALLIGSIRFEGNEVFGSRDLLLAVNQTSGGLKTGQPFHAEALREAEEALLFKYHRDGFLLASVNGESSPAGAGRADITFRVKEERRVYLRGVSLVGAQRIRESEALSLLELQPRRLFGVISKGYYVPERVEEDIDRLRDIYRSRGFLSAEAGFEELSFNGDMSAVYVTFRVKEGPRSTLAGARVEGSKLFPQKLLERAVDLPGGDYYSGEVVAQAYRRLVRWYEEHADIVPKIIVRNEYGPVDQVTVVFQVKEEEHYETGLVTITGNRRTRDRVVRRDVTLVPGKPFTLIEVERTSENLEKRGFYSSVELKMEDRSDPDKPGVKVRDIEVAVEEREHTGLFEAGGGASSGSGGVGYVRLRQPNFDLFRPPRAWDDWTGAFLGGGQYLDVELIPGVKESQYRLRFEEPYFFRSDLSLFLSGLTSVFDRRTYEESHVRGSVGLQKLFGESHLLSGSIQYIADQAVVDRLEDDAPPDAVRAQGHTFLGYPRFELRFDDRELNYYSGPTGLLALANFDLGSSATGSRADFARSTASLSFSLGLFDPRPDYWHVFHAGLDIGWMEGLEGEEAPLFERFYLGGPRSFRGFFYRRLGPHQGRTPVGGEGTIHGTLEYSFPLFWREMRAAAIFDWGDLEPGFSKISSGRFRAAAGGGLLIRLKLLGQPVPASLFWVKALSSEAGDREQVFSFSVGLGF